ncbi:unnamed protein product [Debaryomyces tyrocola]|nr:unnamed protein product [Debaryomyces tyrocola]
MSTKESALIDVGYPIYGAKFVNNKTIIVTGGGGEGNNGIPNKITAIKCSFKVSDKSKRLQKFREIVLPKNEDSPMCLDIAKDSVDNEHNFSVFVGCNQSTQLLKSMNINNNLRKYVFTGEEHLRFVDAAQLEENISGEGVGEYPKIVCLSSHNSVGCLMTSRNPSVIYIFNPDLLELNFKFRPERDVDILDFHLSPGDDGKTLCYITVSSIETISTVTGNSITSTTAVTNKALAKYNLSKVRFIDDSNIIVAASLKNGKGVSIFQYSIPDKKILKQRDISTKIKGITAIDISLSQGLVALAGNDTSVTVLRLADFKTIKTFTKLHSFAITKVAFSPRGTKLASVSAANTLHVMKIPSNYSNGKSIIGTLVHYIFMAVLACLVAVFLQKFYENGQLKQFYELSSHYGQVGIKLANEYGVIGYQFVKEKIRGENVDGDDTTKQYFKMDEWNENETPQSSEVSATSFVESYSTETTEIASTMMPSDPSSSSDDNIDIRAVTKDIDDITKDNNVNTESFFNDTNNYIEESTIINAPNVSTNNLVESMVVEITEINAAETDVIPEDEKTETVSDATTESTSNSTEISYETEEISEEMQSDVDEYVDAMEDVEVESGDVIEGEVNETQSAAGCETDADIVSDAEDVHENGADMVGFDNEGEVDGDGVSVEEEEEEEEEEEIGETETDNLDIKDDDIYPVDSNDIAVDDDEDLHYEQENEDINGDHDDDHLYVTDENDEIEKDAAESEFADSVDSAEAHEPEQIARDTESNEFKGDEPVGETIIEDNESAYEDDIERLTPDQVDVASNEDFLTDSDIEDTVDKTDDSRPADSPIMENNIEKDVESEVDDPRPADFPHVDSVDERDIESATEPTSDGYIVDDSTFDQDDDVKTQTVSQSSISKHDVDPSEVVSQSSVTAPKEQSISISEESIVSKPFTSKISTTESSITESSTTESSTTEPSTTESSTINISTTGPIISRSSLKQTTSELSSTASSVSKASSKGLSTKRSSKTRKAKSTKVTTQPNPKAATTEALHKTVLSSKLSSSTSSPPSKIKSATKSSSKKTRSPKKSLSRRLTKSRTAEPKSMSQLHDEL